MLTSASTSRTGRSVLEAPVGQLIAHFQDLRLTGRVLAPEREEAHLVLLQVHLTANQAVGPHVADPPGAPQQRDFPPAVGPPQVDQAAARPRLRVQLPAG